MAEDYQLRINDDDDDGDVRRRWVPSDAPDRLASMMPPPKGAADDVDFVDRGSNSGFTSSLPGS
jgi:hypothetical protein